MEVSATEGELLLSQLESDFNAFAEPETHDAAAILAVPAEQPAE